MKPSLIVIAIIFALLSGCATTDNDLVCFDYICKPKGFTIIKKDRQFDEIKRDLKAKDADSGRPSLRDKI